MFNSAQHYPPLTREDKYFETLEAFLRTSAGYLDVDPGMPCQGSLRGSCERAISVEASG